MRWLFHALARRIGRLLARRDARRGPAVLPITAAMYPRLCAGARVDRQTPAVTRPAPTILPFDVHAESEPEPTPLQRRYRTRDAMRKLIAAIRARQHEGETFEDGTGI